jgi:hypothetical protein
MDISAIVTVVVWVFAMVIVCGAFAGLRRNSCFLNRRRRVSLEASAPEGGVASANDNYSSPPFVFMYNVYLPRLDTVAPEIVYGSEESFLKQERQLKDRFVKRYMSQQVFKQDEKEDSLSLYVDSTTVTVDDGALSGTASREKSVLEEELYQESISKPSSDAEVENNEEVALLAFREFLQSQSVCVICLEDFEKGCPVRILRCMHLFHSACLRQWLTKSLHCPLCKKHLFREPRSQPTRRFGYRSLTEGSNVFSDSHFLARNSPEWFHMERLEYQMRGQSWQNRNTLTAFI